MDTKHKLKLIEGTFTPAEALKVILDLIGSKIHYHTLEAFSIKERFNGDISYSEKRIEELQQARNDLNLIVQHASEKGLSLALRSFIEITLVKEN